MSIRWIHSALNSKGERLDVRLMTLHDIWVEIWKKDKTITYAWLAEWLSDQGYAPVAIDDKQTMYFAIYFGQTDDSRFVNGTMFAALTGEKFFQLVYQPFGSDEIYVRSPIVYPVGRLTKTDQSQESAIDVVGRPSPSIIKQMKEWLSE